ncbi:MAG TPA: ABC transporter ATP-binding protein, partial [Terriglobales bacterium]
MTTRTSVQEQEDTRTTGSTASPVIVIDHLRHQYGDRTALNGVTFEVRPAEIFGLLGPNGSGKTTMFRILSTLMLPSAGRALIQGIDVAQNPAAVRRQIGVVFQSPSIDVKLTARENLIHVAHLYGIRGRQQRARVDEMLKRVSLDDRANDRAET